MIEFTQEFIAETRKTLNKGPMIISKGIILAMLEEIERLQTQNEQVCEYHRDSEVHLWKNCKEDIQIILGYDHKFCHQCGRRVEYMEGENAI